jgi:glycosyltransferase involved in cell wall biosynthesis
MWGNGLGKKINSVINKIFLLSEKLSFKYCDHIILLSSFFEQKVKKLNIPFTKVYQPYFKKKPINNINLYVKNFKKKYSIHRSDNIIICMGNAFFDTEKIILDTLEKLRIKKIKFKCIFMGKFQISNHNKNKYRKLANKNIINLGFVNDKSLFESVMKMGSLYILPMARDLIEKSRFPVRIYDYINRNKIIVTNATGEMSYIFKKYKIGILTKYSSEYFYRGIIQSLKISKLQKKNIIKNQMKIIKNIFDNKKIAKKLIDIIEQ